VDVVSAGIEVVGSATVVIEVEDNKEAEEVDEVGAVIVVVLANSDERLRSRST
jgi:hypothetical protein